MSGFRGKAARLGRLCACLALAALAPLAACAGLDEGGINVIEPPGQSRAPTVSLPGVSPWTPGDSGGYQFYSGEMGDVDHDAHDCVLDDISTSGFDLHQVKAQVEQTEPGGLEWYPSFIIMMMPPVNATPDQFTQWVVEIQNYLGLLIINQYEEMDDDEFDGQLPEASLWSNDAGVVGLSLRLTGTFTDPNAAAQALVPWFENLTVSVRTEAEGGAVCDEVSGSSPKVR